jgi:Bacteriocin-protection, YdeI or OmpD-Associated
VHKLPADFRKAIESDATAKRLWIDITPLARNEWICWVTSPKKEETRKRRIEVGIDKLRGGMRRPCCWPGCPHPESWCQRMTLGNHQEVLGHNAQRRFFVHDLTKLSRLLHRFDSPTLRLLLSQYTDAEHER